MAISAAFSPANSRGLIEGSAWLGLMVGDRLVLQVELDFSKIAAQRQGWPFFHDRRIDAYAPLEQRYLDGG